MCLIEYFVDLLRLVRSHLVPSLSVTSLDVMLVGVFHCLGVQEYFQGDEYLVALPYLPTYDLEAFQLWLEVPLSKFQAVPYDVLRVDP